MRSTGAQEGRLRVAGGLSDGRIDNQIRDLEQTVIGNPAHDCCRELAPGRLHRTERYGLTGRPNIYTRQRAHPGSTIESTETPSQSVQVPLTNSLAPI